MSSIRSIRSPGLRHADYADAAVIPAGFELVTLAGCCPLDADGATVAPGDIAAQTRAALGNLDAVLRECDADLADIAFIRVLVATTDRDDLATAWTVVRERFGAHEPPGTLQGVTVLGYPDQLVEIEAVAARPTRPLTA
jgi:enamine deaminase RidA (YjgF/YER057c/UK114 family)